MGTALQDRTVDAFIDADVILGPAREIAADDGISWDHTIDFDVAEVQKALGTALPEGETPPKPMFAQVDVLYVGASKKEDGSENVGYAESTVQETARLLPGTMAYLGHQKDEDKETEYRTPTGRYVSARIVTKDVPGVGRVKVCEGKCYISAAAKDFRTHLREGLAGPVSIHGTAAFAVQRGRRTNQTVGMRRLRSVDFCNPGTPGMRHAGVTAVVREIAGEGGQPTQGASKMSEAVVCKSIADLQREYPDLCRLLAQEETASYEKTVTEVTARAEKAEERVTELEAEVKEIGEAKDTADAAHKEATERADKAEATVKEQAASVALTKVEKALGAKIDSRLDAAKEGEDKKAAAHEAAVIEMARKRFSLDADVLAESDDENLTLSLAAAEKAFDAEIASVREMAKEMGVTLAPTNERDVTEITQGGKTTTKNRTGDRGDRMKELLPSYARQEAGWKKGDDK